MSQLTVRLEYDPDADSPADSDGAWTPYSFGTRHRNFKEPTELGLSREQDSDGLPIVLDAKLRRKLKSGLAFFLSYYEHGSSHWFLYGETPPGVEFRWDGVRVAGLLVWDHNASDMGAKTYEDRRKDAEQFLRSYTNWCNGQCYYFCIEDEDGETVDSCGGFDDAEYMFSEIRPHLIGHEYTVEGDAAYLADHHSLDTEPEKVEQLT